MTKKPILSFWQIFNMSFGFFGIQMVFATQGGNMSRIFQTLGARDSDIPLLWLAAPLSGLIIQPIIGYMSDRTWTRFGRRKPYFFFGVILSFITLLLMPTCTAAWMAAVFLCFLDSSINISMEPFRALVADKVSEEQRTFGFTMQSVLIGAASVFASYLPNLFQRFDVANTAPSHMLPDTVKYSFYVTAVFLIVAIFYTLLTTPEYPPEDMEEFEREKRESKGLINFIKEILHSITTMPRVMRQVAIVQLFSWFALFAMWANSNSAITARFFHTSDPTSVAYNEGSNFLNVCFVVFNIVCTVLGFLLPSIAGAIGRKWTHCVCLLVGAAGFLLIYFVPDKEWLYLCYGLIGVAWCSILSMPYTIISAAIPPKKMGVYMGLFNMFICIPQIIASIGGLNFLKDTFIGKDAVHGLVLAGIFMLLASISTFIIKEEIVKPG
jgi:maltose/moltooligosaccharide transporter